MKLNSGKYRCPNCKLIFSEPVKRRFGSLSKWCCPSCGHGFFFRILWDIRHSIEKGKENEVEFWDV